MKSIMPLTKHAPSIVLSPHSGICGARFEKVSRYIGDNIDRSIQSSELAEIIGMAPTYFSREFRRLTGMTTSEYITAYRVNVAKDMLSASDRSLAAVAISCGFSSQSHFTTAFKRAVGETPAAWRAETSVES